MMFRDDAYYVDRRPNRIDPDEPNRWQMRTNSAYDPDRLENPRECPSWLTGQGALAKYRSIFVGEPTYSPDGLSWGSHAWGRQRHQYGNPGDLNFAPVGLGCLPEGGYTGDARLYLRPSSGGTMPPPMCARGDPQDAPDGSINGITSPKQLQRAGGFDKQTVMYGDYRRWAQTDFGGPITHGFIWNRSSIRRRTCRPRLSTARGIVWSIVSRTNASLRR